MNAKHGISLVLIIIYKGKSAEESDTKTQRKKMSGKQAIQRIKEMVERCKYSTMRKVSYVALQCENGVSVKMENCNTIWKWWVTENQQPKLQQIKHKKKPCERRKKCLIQKAG